MSYFKATWKELFLRERQRVADASSVVAWTTATPIADNDTIEWESEDDSADSTVQGATDPADETWFNAPFDGGYGSPEGCPFTLWTVDFVYFPICYDGAEWVGSAPRNPRNEASGHQGGG